MTTNTLNIAARCHTASRLEIDWYLAGALALLALSALLFAFLVATAPLPAEPITIISVR